MENKWVGAAESDSVKCCFSAQQQLLDVGRCLTESTWRQMYEGGLVVLKVCEEYL